MARIDSLGNFLTDVAEAIRTKKGTTDTIPASNFDSEIASIEGGGKYAPKYIRFTGYTGTDLTEETSNLDTSNLTSMRDMFSECTGLNNIDVSNFNTSNVTTMRNTFYLCAGLSSLNLKNWNTSNVTNMYYTFSNCTKLTSIDVSNWDTVNVTNMYGMFSNCANLPSLDLSSWNTSNVTNMGDMFSTCKVLKHLDIRNFDFTKVTINGSMFTSVPTDCEIIVKDDTAKSWVLARRSDFTNVKTVAELEASA